MKNSSEYMKKGFGWVILFVAIYLVFFLLGAVEAKEYTIGVQGRIDSFDFFDEQIKVLNNATEKDRVTIMINSEGGYVVPGKKMIQAMRESKAHVRVIVDRFAMSMAAKIALAGDELRYMKDSWFLFHSVTGPMRLSLSFSERKKSVLEYEKIAGVKIFILMELESMIENKCDVIMSAEEVERRLRKHGSKLLNFSDENPHAFN